MLIESKEPVQRKGFSSGDYFKRKNDANNLLVLLKANTDKPFVLSLNSKWGNGKTWFVKHCIEEWEDSVKCVYYDAWKDEIKNDPFLSFCNVICSYLYENSSSFRLEDNITVFKNTFLTLAKYLIPILSRFLLGKAIDIDAPNGLIQAALTGTDGLLTELTQSIKEKDKIETEFKKQLSKYAKEISGDAYPLVIFIDELDRCSPTYLIHFLEVLKHYFDINNITYILSVDREQLYTSLKHHYGADIQPDQYFRKIITLQYNLYTNPFGWSDYITDIITKKDFIKRDTSGQQIIELLTATINPSPRDIMTFNITLSNFFNIYYDNMPQQYISLEMYIFLIFLKVCSYDDYLSIQYSKNTNFIFMFIEKLTNQRNWKFISRVLIRDVFIPLLTKFYINIDTFSSEVVQLINSKYSYHDEIEECLDMRDGIESELDTFYNISIE